MIKRISSIKNRIKHSSNIDLEFFSLPMFGNSVELVKNNSLYTFKGNYGNGLRNIMDKNFLPIKKMDVLFKKINNNEITIEAFFMLELYTIIKAIVDSKKMYPKVNKKTLTNLLVCITTQTWYKPDDIIEHRYVLDMDSVKNNIALTFKDYQENQFKRYEYLKNKFGYRGMLLDVAAGGGKTLMALALAFAVKADVVIIITLNQNLQTTWVDSLLDDSNKNSYYFKHKVEKKDVYTVADYNNGVAYNGARYVIFNYEAMDKLSLVMDKMNYSNPTIIIDEAHNFVSLKSNRREELLRLVNKSKSEHIFPLTGTSIKDSPLDMGIYIELIDLRSNADTSRIFREIYGSPNKLLKEIVPIRYGNLSIKVEKHELKLDPIEYITLDITIDKPERYSLENIKLDMKRYFDTRLKELTDNVKTYRDTFTNLVNKARAISKQDASVWDRYLKDHTEVRKLYDSNSLYLNPTLAKTVTMFETNNIVPVLSSTDKELFKDATTILKYPILKVRGEVLGRVVLKARIDCHREMAEKIDYSILNTTVGKSVFMSSYIPVCEAARDNLKKQGFNPIEIYGAYTKDQDNRIRLFKNDPNVDPLVGTMKSISTAHHFTVADMILLGDTPFRTYILDQAIARAWRTGQTNNVKIIYTRLKYEADNINSRNIDILTWAKSMVKEITGNDVSYLDFEKARSIDNIDLESFYGIEHEDNNQTEENEMKRVSVADRINKGVVISNETGDVTNNIDSEGFIATLVEKAKNLFKKKEEVKKKKVVVDCSSELTYTTMEKLTADNEGSFFGIYNAIIDGCENNEDILGLISTIEEEISDVDKALMKGIEKVPSRKLKDSEYDSNLFDQKKYFDNKAGFDLEREFQKMNFECNEDTIEYINGDIWINDNEKEPVDKKNIDKLHSLNKTYYEKILKALDILEKGIVVNKVDAEGFKDVFNWIKEITTSDKTKMKDYGVKTTYAVYNLMDDALEILGGEFLDRGIAFLDDEDSKIPVHIDEIEEAIENINALIKSNSKSTIFTLNTKSDGDPYNEKWDTTKDLIKIYANKAEAEEKQTIKIAMTLLKGKKLSSGFTYYIEMADVGIKTYEADKDVVKALTDFKKAIQALMSYVDSNTKLVKLDSSDIDKETFESIDHESINDNDDYILTTKTVDEEAIMIPIAIAAGAYIAYKAAEEYMIENYGKKRNLDLDSFDVLTSQNNTVIMLNHSTDILSNLDELITSTDGHLVTIASDNIKATDLESFDVFKGLASTGLTKASNAIDKLKAMLKTNTQDYKEISDRLRLSLDKEIAIPRGFVGTLLEASTDILNSSVCVTNIKSNIDTTITELSAFVNSTDSRESSILNSSFINIIDKNSKDLYLINSKYLTNGREDRIKVYNLISNANDIAIINTNLRNASKLLNPVELAEIKQSLSMVDNLVRTLVSNQDKFSKIKMKEIGLLIDHLISYVSGVATLVYLKNSVDIMLDDIKKVM